VDKGHRIDNWTQIPRRSCVILRLAAYGSGDDRRLDERVPYWALQFTGEAVCQGKSGAW